MSRDENSERAEQTPPDHWLAYELHDGLLQWILSARMNVDTALARLGDSQVDSGVDGVRKNLSAMRQMLDAAGEEGRQLIHFLENPLGDEEVDLRSNLKAYVDSLAADLDRNGQDFCFASTQQWPKLDARQRWNLLRIVQQAIKNSMTHAGSCSISVASECNEGSWSVQVVDDGQGFDLGQPVQPGHFGLAGMRHRADLIGARFEIQSQPGVGTQVQLTNRPASEK